MDKFPVPRINSEAFDNNSSCAAYTNVHCQICSSTRISTKHLLCVHFNWKQIVVETRTLGECILPQGPIPVLWFNEYNDKKFLIQNWLLINCKLKSVLC